MQLREIVPAVRWRRGIYWSDGVILVSGCSRVSEECLHCWSLRYEKRFGIHGGREGVIEVHGERLERAVKCGIPQLYSIWNDFFHEGVKVCQRRYFLDLMSGEEGRRHYYIILTKRIERLEQETEFLFKDGKMPQNVIFGFTAGTQNRFDERYQTAKRLRDRYGIRFLCSVEPILGQITFPKEFEKTIRWLVIGAETGPQRRIHQNTFHWMKQICEACREKAIPVFVKDGLGSELEKIREFPD